MFSQIEAATSTFFPKGAASNILSPNIPLSLKFFYLNIAAIGIKPMKMFFPQYIIQYEIF